MFTPFILSTLLISVVHSLNVSSYANDFVDPDYILARSFNETTTAAQQSIIQWADEYTAKGPWSVMNKSVTPPSGNKHDYLSWAPYSWPNCTGVGNTTELTPEQMSVECQYYTRDGIFNPDHTLVTDNAGFGLLSDTVLYNAIAWALTGQSNYSTTVANYVSTWFLNPDTAMLPNLNYGQLHRGPTGQNGSHTGVLDLKNMAKIVSGLLILRNGNSTAWTSDLNTKMESWMKEYISWLTTAPIALEEGAYPNNHGTFYYNQLSAIQVFIDDKTAAQQSLQKYFSNQYMKQIVASGDQPEESARPVPYHYRAYNLAAMITNARIAKYIGYDVWNLTTSQGATIQTALDFAMVQTTTTETDALYELYQPAAAVAAAYGDPTGKYAQYLAKGDNTYPEQAYFLWSQPLSDSGLLANSSSSGSTAAHQNAARADASIHLWALTGIVVLTSFIAILS
ncbi:hypothetical protein PLICRDRAFT_105018 [Plicaturopsis crispa FD-325 SS-3]|nr:hypothetical protein PLICRDRAFT_105018 [Plicaturopsis crispa FD-325 SS-3]